MPGSQDPNVIDGFSSVQAARRAKGRGAAPRLRPATDALPRLQGAAPAPDPASAKPAARIGHTVVPDRHDICCFECAYSFVLTGRLHDTFCPKCHAEMKAEDITIETDWTRPVQTIGTVDIKPSATLKNVRVIAQNVVLAGNAEDSTLQVCGCLDLCAGARFNMDSISLRDLVVRRGGRFSIRSTVNCRDLTVEGDIKAKIYTEGTITVRPGGWLRGEVHGHRVNVEEGGGLSAKLFIGPDEGSPHKKKSARKPAPKAKRTAALDRTPSNTATKRAPQPK